mmetsp:Transcript_15638/g.33261  ORF Transcript_15638/g.33261 Transcript_15638/m.33261 type:complete len:236 (-) Transcript_15638:15-722(-)
MQLAGQNQGLAFNAKLQRLATYVADDLLGLNARPNRSKDFERSQGLRPSVLVRRSTVAEGRGLLAILFLLFLTISLLHRLFLGVRRLGLLILNLCSLLFGDLLDFRRRLRLLPLPLLLVFPLLFLGALLALSIGDAVLLLILHATLLAHLPMLSVVRQHHLLSGLLILSAGEEVGLPLQETEESVQDVVYGPSLLGDVEQDPIKALSISTLHHRSQRLPRQRSEREGGAEKPTPS